jgi:hypothetical protein
LTDWKIHECQRLPKNGIRVIYSDEYLGKNEFCWQLEISREATEEHLEENHHLEEIGQTIWTTVVEIECCPYCGESLYSEKMGTDTEQAEFLHIDSSSWNCKVV